MTHWLNYGGGVNSTALLVLLCEGRLGQYTDWRVLWSDTRDEKHETYRYIEDVIEPWMFARRMRVLERVAPREGVLERWQRLRVVGSRTLRSCTVEAKIRPIERYLRAHAEAGDQQLIGIDAGEPHRAKPSMASDRWAKCYPLVDLGIDRDGCVDIIERAGLPVPPKSGCWHCPFMRVGELRDLFVQQRARFETIEELERVSLAARPIPHAEVALGKVRAQWGDKAASTWRKRFEMEIAQGVLPFGDEPLTFDEVPCGCFDGTED